MRYQSKPTCWHPPLFWGIPWLCCRACANPNAAGGKGSRFLFCSSLFSSMLSPAQGFQCLCLPTLALPPRSLLLPLLPQ